MQTKIAILLVILLNDVKSKEKVKSTTFALMFLTFGQVCCLKGVISVIVILLFPLIQSSTFVAAMPTCRTNLVLANNITQGLAHLSHSAHGCFMGIALWHCRSIGMLMNPHLSNPLFIKRHFTLM